MSSGQQGNLSRGWLVVVALLGVALLAAPLLNGRGDRPPHTPEPLPPLWVEGWLNADGVALDEASLRGKVVLLDCWAIWCKPCVMALPELAELNEEFGDRPNFQLISVTGDSYQGDADELAAFEAFVGQIEGFNWPSAHGGRLVFETLEVRQIPTLMVFNRAGMSVYRGHDVRQAREAAAELLAE